MTQINISEQFQPYKYLLISRVDDSETIVTTRIVISDENVNSIRVVNIEQGPQGDKGETGPQGPAGQDGASFDILPVNSGGTNNTSFTDDKLIYFDGSKLLSSTYSVQDIIDEASLGGDALTGVIPGDGLSKTDGTNNVTLDVLLGEGLEIGLNNEIVVDDTIARVSDLDLGVIEGQVPISKGGTNNNFFTQNRFVYFDGTKIRSFPIATGNFLFSGIHVNIEAGSGLIGGGSLEVPNGTITINIPSGTDIHVEEDSISLTEVGSPGTYSKVTTDSKGRVIAGSTLTQSDLISILGYTPYHPGNDGEGSNLDADLLDGNHGSYYRNAANITGVLDTNVIPSSVEPGTYTKVAVGSNGLVTDVYYANQQDIIDSLGYTPVPSTGTKVIDGDTTLNGELTIYDNLPLLATNNANILPDTPRGVSFVYGGLFSNKTGILAYYPAEDQLKLVTNVFAVGADTDTGGNQDDLNGGNADSIYVLQNLDGDDSVVLLKHIADTLYVKTTGTENIGGTKIFEDQTIFKKPFYINDPAGNSDPPFNVSSNTRKVINLNSDLLDGEHGAYYKDASSITGSFSYENVSFDHIQGQHRYIAKFNDTVNDPAARIDDSYIFQDDNGNINIDNNQNVIIGTGNLLDANNSLSVGTNSGIDGNNNLVVGNNNSVQGNNSVALNSSSKVVNANNSIALGDHGLAYLSNQIAVGNFNVDGPDGVLEHGQHTTINMYLPGTEAGNTWRTLTPTVTIPNNKTFAYRLEMLMTKAFGTGVAQYNFESGIFKNATFRDSNNIVDIINVTTQPQAAKKNEIFNNSQIKNHYHTFANDNGQKTQQDVRISAPPLSYNDLSTNNVADYYLYTSEPRQTSGTYYKTNDGHLVLDINKPIYSGSFVTSSSNRYIAITSKNHGVKANSKVDLRFDNVTGLPLANNVFDVFSVGSKDLFFAEKTRYSGYLSYSEGDINNDYATITISRNSISPIDSLYLKNSISGNVYSDNIYGLSDSQFTKNLLVDTPIIIQSGAHFFNRLVVSSTDNSIEINTPIGTGQPPSENFVEFYGPIRIYQIDYSFNFFKSCPNVFVDLGTEGQQNIATDFDQTTAVFQGDEPFASGYTDLPEQISIYTTGDYELVGTKNSNTVIGNDYTNQTSIIIENLAVPKRSTYEQNIPVTVVPLLDNAGSVFLPHKTDISGTFDYTSTDFDKYTCWYTRYFGDDGTNTLTVYHPDDSTPISLPYTPVVYELVAGVGDDDNNQFEIIDINDQYYLSSRYLFDYEQKNIYSIRIKATDRSGLEFFEKALTITVNDTRSPYKISSIPDQTVEKDDLFDYTIPANLFNAEDNEGSITLSATLQNGDPLPTWLSFNPSTRNFNGTPLGCDLGTINIRVFAQNNFSTIYDDFYLRVVDYSIQAAYDKKDDASITDILLDTYSIDENLPSGSYISQLSCEGSYHPYLDFKTASNSFTGIFRDNSDIVECLINTINSPVVSISGRASLLESGCKIEVNNSLNLPTPLYAEYIYKPFVASGTPALTGNSLYLNNSYSDTDTRYFSGLYISNLNESLPSVYYVNSFSDFALNATTLEPMVLEDDSGDKVLTQSNEIIVSENSLIPDGSITENTVWGSGYADCNDGILIGETLIRITTLSALSTDTSANTDGLYKLNAPIGTYMMKGSLDRGFENWNIPDPIDNLVLGVYDFGSPDFCTFLTEDNNLLKAENSDDLISDNDADHGSRVEFTSACEVIEGNNLLKDNGYLLTDFDLIISEDGQRIVSDYAVASRNGDGFILFPGFTVGDISFIYPENSPALEFPYNWGKLIPFVFYSDKEFIRINHTYHGNNLQSIIQYTGIIPDDSNYIISGIKFHNYPNTFGDCPVTSLYLDSAGFDTNEISASGYYVTGLVDVYTQPATGVVKLIFERDINLDERDYNNLYLYDFEANDAGLSLPSEGQHTDFTILSPNFVSLFTSDLFFKPDDPPPGINNGSFKANIDRNHEYVIEESSIINRIPVEFKTIINQLSGTLTNASLKPKDYAFDIGSISGNKITVRDDKNYLLKETGRLDYFEQYINSNYLTNGIAFSGSLFHDHKNIYDVRYNFYRLNENYETIPFRYNHSSGEFSFVIDSGNIKPFDNIYISFPDGYSYSSENINSLILSSSILSRQNLKDLEPFKDNLLLESSESIDATENTEQIRLKTIMSIGKSIEGSCNIDNSIINRLRQGFFVNHPNSNVHGYEIDAFVSGFAFTGVVPKNNNVLSTDIASQLDENHIGHASVFTTGSDIWYSGARILREAESSDVGYAELYLINTDITADNGGYDGDGNNLLKSSDLGGVGTTDSPFIYLMSLDRYSSDSQYMEFLYLGQNDNTISITGLCHISGSNDLLRVYHMPLSGQIYQYQKLINENIVIEDTIVYQTGSVNDIALEDELTISFPIKRFDIVRVELIGSNGDYSNDFNLNTYVENEVSIKPYILESSDILNTGVDYYPYLNPNPRTTTYVPSSVQNTETESPQYVAVFDESYTVLEDIDYAILPYIKTQKKYCGDEYLKNNQVFFNGNVIELFGFDTIKSFLSDADEVKIGSFNGSLVSSTGVSHHFVKLNKGSEKYIVSGISIEGAKTIPPVNSGHDIILENSYRHNLHFGVNDDALLPNYGSVSFVKSISGTMSILDYDNIHYHSYGGTTSRYPLDDDGELVPVPQTGTYYIVDDRSACISGSLCVIVSGFNTSAFTGINDISNRSEFYQNRNTIDINDTRGSIQPFGVDTKLFFDFDDEFPEISDTYYIKDLLAPNVLSISIPYNSNNYIAKSGLVYLIHSSQNIKSHLNPNLDNSFINVNGNFQGLTIGKKIFDYYDNSTKRWKHTVHLSGQPPHTGYDITLSGEDSRFYSINGSIITVSGISYSFDGLNFTSLTSDHLDVPKNVNQVVFKITTLNGDQSLFDSQLSSTPKVSMSGISDYKIEFNEPDNFGWHGSGWNIGLKWTPPAYPYSNTPIVIRTQDFTGYDDTHITISEIAKPEIVPIASGFVVSGENWKIGFDINNINVASEYSNQTIFLSLVNNPAGITLYQPHYSDSRSVVYTGSTIGAEIGDYYPQLRIVDTATSQELTRNSGVLTVAENLSDRPSFNMTLNNFDSTYYVDLEQQEQIIFDVPADLGPEPDTVKNSLLITFGTNSEYNIVKNSSSFNNQTNRFEVYANPMTTGSPSVYLDKSGKYTSQNVTITFPQAVYDSQGNYTYQSYSKTFNFNTVFYKPMSFEHILQQRNIDFSTNEPWSLEFYLVSGIREHDTQNEPDVRIFNTPSLGSYQYYPAEYTLDYSYEQTDDGPKWKVTAIGTQDDLKRFNKDNSLYNVNIYAEDGKSSGVINDEYSIQYSSITGMKNISANVYGTPDNEFFTKVDVLDPNETSNDSVSFPSELKESSIRLNTIDRKYDRDFGLWEQSYVSDKMTDKYDARLFVDGDEISVQCKGLGKDKVIAVAKLHTLEIESNELQGLPLTITGVLNFVDGVQELKQGEEWELEFYTIGGLSHPNYPPTILLDNMPTFCSGFNPLIDTQLQCLVSDPEWQPNYLAVGGWKYHFKGLASCTIFGRKDFSITAIDTDPALQNPYLPDIDYLELAYDYQEGDFAPSPPFVSEASEPQARKTILPLCGPDYYVRYNFGPADADISCVSPTGIKEIDISGSLPPGLNYSVYFPEQLNTSFSNTEYTFSLAEPYSDLSSGYVEISGYPTSFASGQNYEEQFKITVTDARDLSAEQLITFTDSSVANDPDVGIAVYFDKPYGLLTPKSGEDIIESSSAKGWRPPPIIETTICQSILPHNKCQTLRVSYQGEGGVSLRVPLTPEAGKELSAGDLIYISFDLFEDRDNNGIYTVQLDPVINHLAIYTNSSVNQNENQATVVIAEYKDVNLSNFNNFFAESSSLIDNTSYCLLGGGRVKAGLGFNPSFGLAGYIWPSFSVAVTSIFPTTDTKLENLEFSPLNNGIDIISNVDWSDCYQTGNLYMSGIVLPPISCEITDPPPGQNRNYSYKNDSFAFLTRLSFGTDALQKTYEENQRTKTINYEIVDLMSETTIKEGTVQPGSSFNSDILSASSGTIYSLKIWNDSDVFPTYKHDAIPYSENEYLWIHKGDFLNIEPNQESFPPIISAGFDKIVVDSGIVVSNLFGIAIGGYIPKVFDSAGDSIESIPYSHTGNPAVAWSTEDYPPLITGIIQENLLGSDKINLDADYTISYFPSTTGTITIENANVSVGEVIHLEFYKSSDDSLKYASGLTITSNEIDGNNIVLKFEEGLPGENSNFAGYANIRFGTLVYNVDTNNNELIIQASNISYSLNDNICVDKDNSNSTELDMLLYGGYISVVSGANNLIYLGNTNSSTGWLSSFTNGDFVSVYKNIYDNLKVMPYNMEFVTEGEFVFDITGRCNTRQNEDLIYKIGIVENPNMPIFDASTYPDKALVPKKYFKNYPLHVNKPIEIVQNTVSLVDSVLSFSIEGGTRPLYDNTPLVQLAQGNNNFSYCGFTRNTTGDGNIIKDVYNSNTDRLDVELTLTSNPIDWSNTSVIQIRVIDDTGSDTYNYNVP